MIRNGNWNTSVSTMDAVIDRTKVRIAMASEETVRRNALRKCKSVGNADLNPWYGSLAMLPLISTTNSQRKNDAMSNRSISRSDDSRTETRTVKSDTACLSPTKPTRADLLKRSAHLYTQKRSPSSVVDFERQSSHHPSLSEKISISNHDRSVLQHFSGFDNSHPTLNLSSCFSDDDETINDGSSFAGDDLASFPTSVRVSCSNITMPSDFTGSNETLTLSGSSPSKRAAQRKLATLCSNSRSTSDFIPLLPRRQNSNRDSSLGGRSKPLVPKHIQCFPMDESPMKPSRQTSVRKLFDGSSSSSLLTSLSIDLSPIKPKRQSSDKFSNSISSNFAPCCNSVDSSPQKPERQKSNSSLLNNYSETRLRQPSRRSILRSESNVQPRLPTLTRRTSIMERETKPSTVTRQHSII
jgi:hypothetical protein